MHSIIKPAAIFILRHSSGRRLTVPNHRELAKGTFRALIREAGLTVDQFKELL